MVGKKSGRALQREEGLARTDNNMEITTWPQVNMINQKNYYTEYLKRDDQYLAWRTQHEENTNRMVREARDRDRALAQSNGVAIATPAEPVDEDMADDEATALPETHGSKIIVIHPGSQFLRIGLASNALPKSVPMCIARKASQNESEEDGGEPAPKRIKTDDSPEKWFGDDFEQQYNKMCADLKVRMRMNRRRLLPNSKELVINFNRKQMPETINEHNDPHRIDWTELPPNPRQAPDYITGQDALRLPEKSNPRYKIFWPMKHGWMNERDYKKKNILWNDFFTIIEDAIKTQLNLPRKKDWSQYNCVFIIPDLYERVYVSTVLDTMMREFGFARVSFMQESVGASFGAGYSSSCIVDVGAQKTSICCVEDGMCVEESRINMKFGGADITELFIKMMMFDHFPYSEINLKRRYDWLLAEELKHRFCNMNEQDVTVQLYDFHLRAAGQDTRKYLMKTYDETMLAAMGYFKPGILNTTTKLVGRRTIIDRSYDLYDASPNDSFSNAQAAVLQFARENFPVPESSIPARTGTTSTPAAITATPSKPHKFSLASRLNDTENTPRSSIAGSPAPEGTPQPSRGESPTPNGNGEEKVVTSVDPAADKLQAAEERDRILPVMPIDAAIQLSIQHGCRGDERKMRDFFGGIMVVGGGAKFAGFNGFLEDMLRERNPHYGKEILIGPPPRELDQQLVVWKGGSVYGRLSSSGNDSWIYQKEYEMLGAKLLAQKVMWNW